MISTVPLLRRSLLGLLASALVLTTVAAEPKPENLTARQILDRTAKVYAQCKSYRDSGVVKAAHIAGAGRFNVEQRFKTAFLRPGRFRFQSSEKAGDAPETGLIVWRQGQDIRIWRDDKPDLEKPSSFNSALMVSTSVSGGGVVHEIPALLFPTEVRGDHLTDLTGARRLGDEKIGDADCYRIEGKSGENPMKLWIDKSSFLVRRIDMETQLTYLRIEFTTTYDPVIDSEVNEEMLALDLPKPSL
jgi:outer membrane lipoprotein-sorting protein